MSTMLDRLSIPTHPVRDVLVRCEMIIRGSCGSIETVEPESPSSRSESHVDRREK
jgi:hypothetical protein